MLGVASISHSVSLDEDRRRTHTVLRVIIVRREDTTD